MEVSQRILLQLEQMREAMQLQGNELERVGAVNAQLSSENVHLTSENCLLRADVAKLGTECRELRDKLMDQEGLLSSLNIEISQILREKTKLEEKAMELEQKYKKARAASKEFARILELENELISRKEAEDELTREKDILEKSRALHRELKSSQMEKSQFESERRELIASSESSKEEILRMKEQLEKEKHYSSELLNDLEKNRTMLLDRDSTISDLKSRLSDVELKLSQTSDELFSTQSDLQMERVRTDNVTLSLHESEKLLAQTHEDSLQWMYDNEQLANELKMANVSIVSLRAKLEAQGVDLAYTKRQLRNLQSEKK